MTWNRTVRLICISTVVGILTIIPAAPAFASLMPALAPQPLANALETIARQAGLQLIYSSSLSNGVLTQGSPAGLSWQDALRTLLKGTGLTFQLVNEHTVTIIHDPQAQGTGGTAAGEVAQTAEPDLTNPTLNRDRLGVAPIAIPEMEQIVITGSHISGAVPVGNKVISITRKEIDRSGYSTVQEVIRALPQNFGGGSSEDTRSTLEDAFNSSRATGLNLRGLGAGSTLVLVNGRRLAASGSDGRFVDVTGIPLTAIERIEVLPDGASAIYGSDAVGGVVNFILRDDYEGAETALKFGSVTSGSTKASQLAQLLGKHWDQGNALLSFEYYARDRLPNEDRRQSADSDLRPMGGDNFDTIQGNPGTVTDGLQSWAIPRGQDGRSLTPDDFVSGTLNSYNRNEGADLLPQHKRWSLLSTARHNLNDRAQLFFDGLLSQRKSDYFDPAAAQTLVVPASNAFYVHPNPALDGNPVWVLYNFMDDLGLRDVQATVTTMNAALGGTLKFGETWDVTAYGMYSSAKDVSTGGGIIDQTALAMALADPNKDTAFNPFGDGSNTPAETLEKIRANVYGRRGADIQGVNLTAEGTLVQLADRDVRVALGADYRHQFLSTYFTQDEALLASRDVGRDVYGVFGELLVPLIPEGKSYPGLKSAQLSLAARHESYSDFGSAATPKIGLTISPVRNLTLRASWARSLKAPTLTDLDTSRNAAFFDLQADPQSPAGTFTLLWNGGNDHLHEETAETWSAGFDYSWPSRNMTFSLGYFDIAFTNRIDQVTYTTSFLQDPIYQDIVTRNPSRDMLEDICRNSIVQGGAESCLNLPVGAVVDMRLKNQAVLQTSGLDFSASHELATQYGLFASRLSATYLFEFGRAQFKSSPLMELLNTPDNPVDLRLRGSVSWDYRGAGASLYMNFMDGYRDTISLPRRSIDSWTTLDLQTRYGASATDPRRLNGMSLALNIENVFDTNPPFYNNPLGIGYDPSNGDLLGRFLSFQIRKAW
jgi:iron complex outermembrane recepter protein